MTNRSAREARAVVAAYDLAGCSSVVDVGGGRGTLLHAVHERVPDAERGDGDEFRFAITPQSELQD